MAQLEGHTSLESVAPPTESDSFDFGVIAIVGLAFSVAGAVSLGFTVEAGAPPSMIFVTVPGLAVSIIVLRASRNRRRRDKVIPILGTMIGGATILAVIVAVLWIIVGFSTSPL